jgi:hypothetical protein
MSINKLKLKNFFLKSQHFFLVEKSDYLLYSIGTLDTPLQSLVPRLLLVVLLFCLLTCFLRALDCPAVTYEGGCGFEHCQSEVW